MSKHNFIERNPFLQKSLSFDFSRIDLKIAWVLKKEKRGGVGEINILWLLKRILVWIKFIRLTSYISCTALSIISWSILQGQFYRDISKLTQFFSVQRLYQYNKLTFLFKFWSLKCFLQITSLQVNKEKLLIVSFSFFTYCCLYALCMLLESLVEIKNWNR